MRHRPASRVVLVLLASIGPIAILAQDPPSEIEESPRFTASSELVVLHVNVLDRRSNVVEELPQSAFEVYEDGVLQQIQFFEPREAPLAVGLLLDRSSSMITRHQMVRAGVEAFAELSRPADEFFTILFNEHVRHGLPPGVPFARSRDLLVASLARTPAGGKTALHDAVIAGLDHLETASNQKRVLVVLTDGDDNASTYDQRTMLRRAAESSALVHTIWTGDLSANRGNPGLLRRLARDSGGVAHEPSDAAAVVQVFRTAAEAVRRGYTIGYAPANTAADGSFRRIEVQVQSPERRLTIHVREGYMARGSVETQ